MGLLDVLMGGGTPEQSDQIMALAQGLLSARGSQGLANGVGLMGQARQNALKNQMAQLQMQAAQQGLQKGGMEMDEMRRKIADEEASRGVIRDFYSNRGLPGASPVGGPAGAVNSALPPDLQIGALPATPAFVAQQGGVTPKAEVWKQYKDLGDSLAANGQVEKAQLYFGLAEKMRPKYSTTPQVVRGPDGKLINILIGEDGSIQQMPYGVKPDMTLENLGGTVRAIDKNALTGSESFARTQTPDSIASNALGWANNALTKRGQDLIDARAREANSAGKVPAGYRLAADGVSLEYIPGGPADPNAAKRAAPTEFQGKSATFGARAQEADKILSSLDGAYSPTAVNAKEALGRVPLVGGALEAAGNAALSDSSQKAEQAQRNFVNAVLRQESGAAISAGEFENAKKQYFPQPGDSPAVKAQKAQNRQTAIRGFLANSRPGSMESIISGTGGATAGWGIKELK